MIEALQKPTDEDIAREANLQSLADAKRKLEAQYRADFDAGQQAHADVRQQRAATEQDATAQLAQLKTLYQARAQAAQKLQAALSEFATAESEIKTALEPISQRLARAWSGLDANEQAQRMIAMRQSVGLLPKHADLGAVGVNKLTRTVCSGLIGGYIGEGGIGVGGRAVQFD
jgi:chromosome segregation ATPase